MFDQSIQTGFQHIVQYSIFNYNFKNHPQNINPMLSSATKTIIGVMIVQFASGFTGDWGVISLYILSYYHYYGAPVEIKSSTNSLLMIILVIPVIFCLFISTKVANKIGYVQLIRICAISYLIIPLFSYFNFSFIMFVLCNMLGPCCSFTLSLIPLFNCMYSYYDKNKNLATAFVIGSFSIGAIVWNLAATLSINPQNIVPDVPSSQPQFNFFPKEIADRVPRSVNVIYLISGLMVIVGMLLISRNQDFVEEQKKARKPVQKKQVGPEKMQLQRKQSKQQQIAQYIDAGDLTAALQVQQNPEFHLRQYLKQPFVILLFLLNIFGCLFQVYLQINTKIIYMPILQDDHLISIGLMLIILSSAIFSVPWGYLADKKGPFVAIIAFLFIDFASKIFACFVKSKAWYLISMVLIGATDKTILVLFGPILIDIYGLEAGTQLLPLKGISGIISVIMASGLGLVLSKYAQKSLFWFCGFNIIGLAIGAYLATLIAKHDKINKKFQYAQVSQ